ncbi:MAG TPA: 1-acyl-sn-glycerol-3-phosphate acyltransferase [Porphyromonadaceae bacterium]|jgi:1-acylglycerol-3-phosphate O-acyltransferases|uniref:1-acyl-sn-glycerol-3-phosphate acyltransferase n=1 Tax=Candidatus Caccoplasma intestinavium TaxID=2840716 RepID=A0A9D1KCY4_9BACT|nr:1-acylglycerol-3-phosphate O-acyltransferase [Bacteroides sp. CAG:144]HCZ20114.1 1-acyl-sn-glycerol-3-phosphate acyltransferase [Porphyromonadaceae bacterium]HIT39898.1 1-acyl-sn-glycerol-3-phosphate acyltransferase [Candidatus Caccoplasma intestinavium]
MVVLRFLYQWIIVMPIMVVITIMTALITIIGCFLGNHRVWGYYPGLIWSRLFCLISLVRIEVRGREKLDRSTSYVFVANHQGAYDIFLIYGYLGHKFKWMMKSSLRRIPFVGAACAAAGFIFVDRSGKGLRETLAAAEKILTGGMSLVVFPEGSRTPDGKIHRFKKGAYQIADDLSLPVVPLTIDGSYRVLSKNSKLIRPGKIVLTVHDPIFPQADGHYDMDALITDSYRVIEAALK